MIAQNALVKAKVGEVAPRETIAPLLPRTADEVGAFVDAMVRYEAIPASYEKLPSAKRKGHMVVAILKGMELGMPPLQALQNIYVVNGIPTIYGDALVAYVMGSKQVASYREWFEGEGEKRVAHVEAARVGVEGVVHRSFSVADAQRQGLLGKKGPWQHSRDRMQMIRARTYVFRDLFADCLGGLKVAEEQEDIAAARGLQIAAQNSGDTRAIDPLGDGLVIEGEIIEPDAAPMGGAAESDAGERLSPPREEVPASDAFPGDLVEVEGFSYDLSRPEALLLVSDATPKQFQHFGKALRTLIERAPTDELKRAWARTNQDNLMRLTEASPALRGWIAEVEPRRVEGAGAPSSDGGSA